MRHQVSEKIGPWVNDAIDIAVGGGEPILWEPQLMPEPKTGRVVMVCVFWITGTGAASMQGSFTIPDPLTATKREVHDLVVAFLTKLFAAREDAFAAIHREQAASADPEPAPAPAAPQNGQTASGLFIATR